jgi:hypothetical protein
MPGFNNDGKAVMLGALRTAITHISLHSASPSTTGANELSGNGYARWAIVTADDFSAVSAGAFTTLVDETFTTAPSQTITHIGIWGAGPTFYGGGTITGDTAANAEGAFILKEGTSINLNAA